MSKIKHNIEYQFINGYKVVDPVNVASHQKPIYLTTVGGNININPTESNYFVVDLGGTGDINFNILDTDNTARFEVLLLEPVGIRKMFFSNNIIFPDYFHIMDDFQMEEQIRREMLITFKRVDDNSFLGIPTCWFRSPNLENYIMFHVKDMNNQQLTDVEILITGGGYLSETKTTVFGSTVFNRSKNSTYYWEASKTDWISQNGYITMSQINQTEPVIVEITLIQ